ncbi:MAG: ATP-binding protein [Bacillota bacterium]
MDDKEIRQLIINLARNGLEAMPPGGVLTIRTYLEGKEVVLAVEDRGKGISSEVMNKIGTPFFTTKDNGTGLGLAICYSIASRHNATLKIETSPEGSAFFVRFEESQEGENKQVAVKG